MIKMINDQLVTNIKSHIDNLNISQLTEKQQSDFDQLKANLNREDYNITFGDLALLKQIKPDTFKNLYITAVSKRDKTVRSALRIYKTLI
jgi:hypothetical protein